MKKSLKKTLDRPIVSSVKLVRIYQELGIKELSRNEKTKNSAGIMLNKKTGFKLALGLTASAIASLLSAGSSAAVIYDNTESYLGSRTDEPNGTPLGDYAIFAGTDRTLTGVSFEYFLSPTRSGNEQAVFSLYALDGANVGGVNLPGTLLYSSTAFNIGTGTTATGFGTANISDLAVAVPNEVAWTVSFTGIEAGEGAGLLFYSDAGGVGGNPTFLDPDLGSQQHFTVRNNNGTWQLLNHDGVVDNLGIQFTAVPEPSTMALMLGGLAMFGFLRRRK